MHEHRRAMFLVSANLIREALAIPDKYDIEFINLEYPGLFRFFITGPDLPKVPEGGMPCEVTPQITRLADAPAKFYEFLIHPPL